MQLMPYIRFISQDLEHFIGAVIIIGLMGEILIRSMAVVGNTLVGSLAAIRGSNKSAKQ